MKKLLIALALISLSSCYTSHTYNIKYKVTFLNGDQQTFDENWELKLKPEVVFLSTERGQTNCVKVCGGCIPNACGVRTVETISVTELK